MKEKGIGERKRGGSFRVGRRNRYCSREGTRTKRGVKQRKRVAEVVQKIRRASRSRRAQAGPTGAGNGMTSQREVQRQVWTRNLELKEKKKRYREGGIF